MTPIWSILLAVLSGIFGGVGAVFLKKGSDKFNFYIKQQCKNYYLLLGIIICGTGMLFLIAALNAGELSVLYPLVSLQYIISTFFSVKYLKEKMNLLKWAGITAIIIGIILIGMGL